MTYEIRLRPAVKQVLDSLPRRDYRIVPNAVNTLHQDPRLIVHKLADSGLWRLRVGRYRLVVAIDNEAELVTILALTSSKK